MKKDHRKLSHDVLEEIRIKSVKMVVKNGLKNKDVCSLMEVGVQMLSTWIGMYKKWGWKALKSKKTPAGRPKDMTKNLTTREKKKLEKFLLKEPRNIIQLNIDSSLWTASIVAEFIKIEFKKSLKEGQIYKLLAELGFTNQKPIFRAYQQDLTRVKEWKEVQRPKIEKEAKKEKREILYGDEAGFKSTDHRWTTWWKKWVTPIVKATGARFSINAASAISKNGVLKFMSYEGSFTSETLIQFLERIIYKIDKKYTLILDWHPTHKTKKVQKWLEDHDFQIKLYYLPPYSPELNPDEQVWHNVKQNTKGRFSASKRVLRDIVTRSLFRLQKKKELISSFFRHPEFL